MSRRAAYIDFSIRGDELEQQRVQLEHNLQHADLSIISDVEYPRHASAPSPPFSAFGSSAFASFDRRSADDFDPAEQNRLHAWSYHTEDGVQPYASESFSTAAHHASALTISAGLGGDRVPRRDLSFSGAEYDPDRPLNGIMAGITDRFKVLDANSTSRQFPASAVDFDPLIVDDTAELDRVLQSGHAPPTPICLARSSSSSSSDSTEPLSPQPQHDSRPRLADTLNHITFSPKRPRSGQGLPSPRMASVTIRSSTPDRIALARHLPRSSSPSPFPASTPRPPRRLNQSLSYAQNSVSHGPTEPEVNILPATPSSKQSEVAKDESYQFTNMVRGLRREIEVEADAMMKHHARSTVATTKPYAHSTIAAKSKRQRTPFQQQQKTSERSERLPHAATPFKKSVQLPDVTGLTSAIASPTRVDSEFYGYDARDTTQAEARLVATLSVVQKRLAHLEAENSVSRRRVRELELELEACKKEVARERTRIMEHEHSMRDDGLAQGRSHVANQRDRSQQQRNRADEDETELAAAEVRYKAAVEEKKALEALITTLRTHLTRLTAELSEHKQLLLELRSLRDSDARALAEKSKEVDKLKLQVEQLASEIEVLRDVVEEGLKERRSFREQSMSHEQNSASETADRSSEEEEINNEDPAPPPPVRIQHQRPRTRRSSVHSESSEEEDEESISRRSPTPSPKRTGTGAPDKTMRTDHATLASSHSASANASKPFLDEVEVSRITQEVEERRSERSIQSQSHEDSQSRAGPSAMFEPDGSGSTVPQNLVHQLEHSVRFAGEFSQAESSSRPPSPAQVPQEARPSAPSPATAHIGAQKRRSHTAPQPQPQGSNEALFPRIRGAHLERLFLSAPEQCSKTCTRCHHRRRRRPAEVDQAASWVREWERERARGHRHEDDEEDEGFAEGPEDARERAYPYLAKGSCEWKAGDRMPPQTVLAKVLRELEDDFTHYKSIYVELADQYKDMDPVSNVVKRNVLADHLREVIDILEQKGDQIASLYDLLTFKDKSVGEPAVPDNTAPRRVPPVAGVPPGRVRLNR